MVTETLGKDEVGLLNQVEWEQWSRNEPGGQHSMGGEKKRKENHMVDTAEGLHYHFCLLWIMDCGS